MIGQNPSHQVFAHRDVECQGQLISNPLVAEAGVPSLHFYDVGNQLGEGLFGPGRPHRSGENNSLYLRLTSNR